MDRGGDKTIQSCLWPLYPGAQLVRSLQSLEEGRVVGISKDPWPGITVQVQSM